MLLLFIPKHKTRFKKLILPKSFLSNDSKMSDFNFYPLLSSSVSLTYLRKLILPRLNPPPQLRSYGQAFELQGTCTHQILVRQSCQEIYCPSPLKSSWFDTKSRHPDCPQSSKAMSQHSRENASLSPHLCLTLACTASCR